MRNGFGIKSSKHQTLEFILLSSVNNGVKYEKLYTLQAKRKAPDHTEIGKTIIGITLPIIL